jgi:AcrR family transcriptional regulator
MARRSDHSREELAALVVGAARDLVARSGRDAVTARAIAERIGYAPGSIYNAVGDLGLVLLRVNAETLGGLAGELEAVVARSRSADPMHTVVAVAEAYMQFVSRHHRLWAAALEPGLAGDAPPEWYLSARERLAQLVDRVLRPFYPDAAERNRCSVALWAALQGVAALSISDNLELEGGRFDAADIARSIVCRYLTGQEPPTRRRRERRPTA